MSDETKGDRIPEPTFYARPDPWPIPWHRPDAPGYLVIRPKRGYALFLALKFTAVGSLLFAVSPIIGHATSLGSYSVLLLLPPAGRVAFEAICGLVLVAGGLMAFSIYFALRANAVLSPVGIAGFGLLRKRRLHWSDVVSIEPVYRDELVGFTLKTHRRQKGLTIFTNHTDSSQAEVRDYISRYRPDLFEPRSPSPITPV